MSGTAEAILLAVFILAISVWVGGYRDRSGRPHGHRDPRSVRAGGVLPLVGPLLPVGRGPALGAGQVLMRLLLPG